MNRITKGTALLFPSYCAGCGKPGDGICSECRKNLIPHPECCPFCHTTTLFGKTCSSCFTTHKEIRGVMIGFVYTKTIKKLILQGKYYHKYTALVALANKIALLIETNPYCMDKKAHNLLFVTYVPASWFKTHFIRGYNQSKLVADTVAQKIGVPVVQSVKKQVFVRSQVSLKRNERISNTMGNFQIDHQVVLPDGAILLIVDDIITTGSTLLAIAKVRKQTNPHLQIRGAVVGRSGY